MTVYAGTTDLQPGFITARTYSGLGKKAEEVPSTGEHGAAYVFPSLVLPGDNGKEVRGLITTMPQVIAGSGNIVNFRAYDDTSFFLEVDGDCTVQWVFDLYVDNVLDTAGLTATVSIGVAGSIGTADLTRGGASFSASGSTTAPVFDATADLTGGARTFTAAATATDPVFDASATLTRGGAQFSADASFSAVVRSASAILTGGGRTISATGSTIAPSFAATATLTRSAATIAANATTSAPIFDATAALTRSGATCAATAATIAPSFAATAALTRAGATFAANAAYFDDAFIGTALLTRSAAQSTSVATFTPRLTQPSVYYYRFPVTGAG